MAQVDAAEKEASEVLHSLLSVERIEKQEAIVDTTENQSPTNSFHSNPANAEVQESEAQIAWHGPVSIAHSLFSSMDANGHFPQTIDDQQVVVFFTVYLHPVHWSDQ